MNFHLSEFIHHNNMSAAAPDDVDIQQWKVKRLIKQLDKTRGSGTSMISLIIRSGDQISTASQLLTEEYGTATNVKSRVNRLSILSAITSAQQRLKLYSRTPPNGLVLFCGEGETPEGKNKKIVIDFEPHKPINTKLYYCGDQFRTDSLSELIHTDETFGFIVMDGNGALYGSITGNNRQVLSQFTVDLPKKHSMGGQSSNRFARLRIEKRHNYLRKVAEMATSKFITNDAVNVAAIVLAGSAEFKNDLLKSDLFDPKLQKAVISIVDVAYGGLNGFQQAIELAKDSFGDVKLIKEKNIIQRFMEEIATSTDKYVYGPTETVAALEQGAVDTLIVWESLDLNIYQVRGEDKEIKTVYAKNPDKIQGEIVSCEQFLEWLTDNYRKFGSALQLVSDRSSEGHQFCSGFGGIGGLLRFRIDKNIDAGDNDDVFCDDDFI